MPRGLLQSFAGPLVASLVFALPLHAADHAVSGADVTARLAEATAQREADLADLTLFLQSPAAQQSARLIGADTETLQARLALLDDAEARDLASRARALSADPAAAGLNGGQIALIVVGGIVAVTLLIWLLAKAQEEAYDYYYY